jgi:hypothetical protein
VVPTAPATILANTLSPRKRAWIVGCAVAYVLATLWQVFWERDDWPLSSFAMYSKTKSSVGRRRVMVGVSSRGEFEAGEGVGRFNLRHLDTKVSPAKSARFLKQLVRSNPTLAAHPDLQAIRIYQETWSIKQHLKGLDRPRRRLIRSHYFAPPALKQELSLQATGGPPLPASLLPRGDLLFELDTSSCNECDEFVDPQAGGGTAVWLSQTVDTEVGGQLNLAVTLPKGRWRVFARVRPGAQAEASFGLSVKGPGGATYEFGETWSHFPHDAWVWASLRPGLPPLLLNVKKQSEFRLVFRAGDAPVSLDQVWFSKQQRELPATSNPLVP